MLWMATSSQFSRHAIFKIWVGKKRCTKFLTQNGRTNWGALKLDFAPDQGDQMSFEKIAQNVAQPNFYQN
jgi:hypothetical protein